VVAPSSRGSREEEEEEGGRRKKKNRALHVSEKVEVERGVSIGRRPPAACTRLNAYGEAHGGGAPARAHRLGVLPFTLPWRSLFKSLSVGLARASCLGCIPIFALPCACQWTHLSSCPPPIYHPAHEKPRNFSPFHLLLEGSTRSSGARASCPTEPAAHATGGRDVGATDDGGGGTSAVAVRTVGGRVNGLLGRGRTKRP
jgi:hypothetical protein